MIYIETAVLHWTVNQRVLQSSDHLQMSASVTRSDVLQGRLVIRSTVAGDTGNYSCLPSYATPDWVMVHIVTGNIRLSLGEGFENLKKNIVDCYC